MALNLKTVAGYVKAARGLLLDKTQPYRYSDDALLVGLNLAIDEAARLRPDIFFCRYETVIPEYDAVSGDEVPVERKFRQALLNGMAGYTLMRDEEDVQDARANLFLTRMYDMLTGVRPAAAPQNAGTPAPQTRSKT